MVKGKRYIALATILCMAAFPVRAIGADMADVTAAGTAADKAPPPAVDFLPPDTLPGKVCAPWRSDDLIQREWSVFDGKRLPSGVRVEDMDRDLARLRAIDAAGFFEIIKQGADLRLRIDSSYSSASYLLDMVNLYIAAGRIADLEATDLISQLQAPDLKRSPGVLNLLGDLYLNGIAVAADQQKGLDYKIQAAYGGNGNAVLDLASRSATGSPPPGWALEPQAAFLLGFGAMLGKADPQICDRAKRIARTYEQGEIVQQNYPYAEAWYRFAAEMGDGDAAWRVAQYHLESQFIQKDNGLLLRYLLQAADSGVVAARFALAKAYVAGALLPADPAAALKIYDDLAAEGNTEAAIAAIQLRDQQGLTSGESRALLRKQLVALTQSKDAPGWAFLRLGRMILEDEGPFVGRSQASSLFNQARERGDDDATLELARLNLTTPEDPAAYAQALDLLYPLAMDKGKKAAFDALWRAQLCLAPDDPDIDLARFWRAEGSRYGAADLDGDQLAEIGKTGGPLDLAVLQSAALSGNADAIHAEIARQTRLRPKDQSLILSAWQRQAGTMKAGQTDTGNPAPLDDLDDNAIKTLRNQAAGGDVQAAQALAHYYLLNPEKSSLAEIEALFTNLGGQVQGDDLWRLDAALKAQQGSGYQPSATVLSALSNSGDYAAILFAASQTTDRAKSRALFLKAFGTMPCTYAAVDRMAHFALDRGYRQEAEHLAKVAVELSSGEPWQDLHNADILFALGSEQSRSEAFALYKRAYDAGYQPAAYRLLDWFSQGDGFYDAALEQKIYLALLNGATADRLYSVASRLKKAPKAVQAAVLARFDLQRAYQNAADAGNPDAMRELGLMLRRPNATPYELFQSTAWLKRAAEANDIKAMSLLADAYAFGIGTDVSRDAATKWLQAAAKAGDKDAQQRLQLMKHQ
ncbi:SEL1-like repeat protein [Martelella sp. HB161492]|uniref:tetratricopeptide repeat protein n=1 Tax=Martelella sp. HB161492 TaxID=2720726 RepID=UPI001590D393|nr:SEL1-like repeat protein [Martelella sp. HB161492]